jgi:RimJ/RimL family protein N-acetyltransferase
MRPIVETERLWLRAISPDDAPAMFELKNNPESVRYTGGVCLTNVEEARQEICERILTDYARHGFGRWAMILKGETDDSGLLIGVAGLKHLDELGEVDIGYRLLPRYWNRGLATEAARAAIDYGFRVLRLPRIIGLVDAPHVASIRVLEKCGLEYEKTVAYRSEQVLQYSIAADAPRP